MRVVMISLALLCAIVGGVLWFTAPSNSVNYPSEKFLKDSFSQSIDKNNAQAQQQFGALMKKNEKMELQSFSLQKCSHQDNDKKITCLVSMEVKSPMYGAQKRNVEFYVREQNGSFQMLGQKQL